MNTSDYIYESFFSQPGMIRSVEKKRVVSEQGILISFYEAQVEYPDGSMKSHVYYPDIRIENILNVWIVFDCLVANDRYYIMHIYS